MKPFPKKSLSDAERILSRFRRISENAFGIWINRFRLFASKATLKPDKVEIVVLASLVLQNMLPTVSRASYTSRVCRRQGWRRYDHTRLMARGIGAMQQFPPSTRNKSRRNKLTAEKARNSFMDYFMGLGQVPWQWNILYD